MTQFQQQFGELLRRRGWNQKAAAAALGYSQANISRWLSGEHDPKLSIVLDIAAKLGVSVADLAGETAATHPSVLGEPLATFHVEHPLAGVLAHLKRRWKNPKDRQYLEALVNAMFQEDAAQVLTWLNAQ